jgi:hypothetical protein
MVFLTELYYALLLYFFFNNTYLTVEVQRLGAK